jgi:hypothetical protein
MPKNKGKGKSNGGQKKQGNNNQGYNNQGNNNQGNNNQGNNYGGNNYGGGYGLVRSYAYGGATCNNCGVPCACTDDYCIRCR